MPTLVIVESPAKARKIQKFLGADYIVMASFGHLLDLPTKRLGVNLTSKSFPLEIVPIAGKQKTIKQLKAAYKKCKGKLILAPDPDREGEAIGYYCAKSLGADPYTTPRISFSEITKGAIMKAVKQPGHLIESSVKAQMARRVLDRILGYKISPFVRKQTHTGRSAGRCQSPALLLLDEKETDIQEALSRSKKKIRSKMIGTVEGNDVPWEVTCEPIPGFPKVNWMTVKWVVGNVIKSKRISSNPPPPFITSSLLSAAANRLGYGTGRTKKSLQQMYEKGWITYIRTDSTIISEDAKSQIRSYLKEELNVKVVNRSYSGSTRKNAQEAHECIRPTLIKRLAHDVEGPYRQLYELIWNRTVASQMEASESVNVSIEVNRSKKSQFVWKGSKSYCVKSGWKQIEGVEEMNPSDIPVPRVNSKWSPTSILVEEVIPNPPRRYNDATFVAALEKIGIGRPSTYASIVETIQSRGYAEVKDIEGDCVQCRIQNHVADKVKESSVMQKVGAERKRLCLTPLGSQVCKFLYPTTENLLGVKATSEMESLLDDICSQKQTYENVIRTYWGRLSDVLKQLGTTTSKQETSSWSQVGTQTLNGKQCPITIEMTRYGPAVVRVVGSKKEYGNIPKGMDVSKITLEEALRLLPLSLGSWNKKSVIAKKGKYGPYLLIGKDRYVTIPTDMDWLSLNETKAKELIRNDDAEKKHADSLGKQINTKILRGPKGWYMRVPKGRSGITIGDTILDRTADELRDLIESKGKSRNKK